MVDDHAALLLFFLMKSSCNKMAEPATVGEDIDVPDSVE